MNFSLTGLPALIVLSTVLLVGFGVPIMLLALFSGSVSRAARRRKQLRETVIVAEYDPPEGLAPVEVGYLFDSKLEDLEFEATLVDLEQRGLVRLSQGSKGELLAVRTSASAPTEVKAFDRVVLDALTDGKPVSLRPDAAFRAAVIKSLGEKGYVKGTSAIVRSIVVRVLVTTLIVLAFVVSLIQLTFHPDLGSLVLAAIGLVFFGTPIVAVLVLGASLMYGRMVGQPNYWTVRLKELWPRLEGYRTYVELVELDQIQFDSAELKERSRNRALPYAIALGMHTDWRRRFQSKPSQ